MRLFLAALVVSGLAGCAGKVDYIRPTTQISLGQNTKLIQKPRDAVWATSVPALSKQFFVINNLDKTSGLINLSYSGDPEKYIDCGRITSFVKNAQGEISTVRSPNGRFEVGQQVTRKGVRLVASEE